MGISEEGYGGKGRAGHKTRKRRRKTARKLSCARVESFLRSPVVVGGGEGGGGGKTVTSQACQAGKGLPIGGWKLMD